MRGTKQSALAKIQDLFKTIRLFRVKCGNAIVMGLLQFASYLATRNDGEKLSLRGTE